MSGKSKRSPSSPWRKKQKKKLVRVDVLGNTRIPSHIRENLVHPDATPFRQTPTENHVEIVLSKIENLIGKGHYGTALREAKALELDNSQLSDQYEFILQEKILRADIGIADRYFIRGDQRTAMKFYKRTIQMETKNTKIKSIVNMAIEAFDNLAIRRKDLFEGLKRAIKEESYEEWCEIS